MTLAKPKTIKGVEISTHTLTWSVTNSSIWSRQTLDISTHTLTWSVTLYGKSHKYEYDISTHTLTWSVTKLTILSRIAS